ncbi:hypothetical protein DSL72_002658 [Monilinia vaccinii-corymbosi]|uniref:SET domain-containing protein n=1 Tax=Monilinia vaccinii-corymbosi TaxID=61207 RepID=A0A8A3PDB9_9HELO|nr:hypothetical protein DSL72_002658 [Monilinia vaccinii-corymbosi]
MRVPRLSLSSLPAWSRLNNVIFFDTVVFPSGHQNGILTLRPLSSVDIFDLPTLLEVPKDLLLDRDFLLEVEKVDAHFKQLRELAGGTSIRKDVMLFLLIQMTIARNDTIQCTNCYEEQIDCFGLEINENQGGTGRCRYCTSTGLTCVRSTVASQSGADITVGVRNPWSVYVRYFPEKVPVPTMWKDQERMLLAGTSLEHVIEAKMSTLTREFEELREKTIGIPWCHSCWWGLSGSLSLEFSDWVLLDAWFRSRSLELSNNEQVLVPCLDMANHSSAANAYWEEISNGDVSLVLKMNLHMAEGSEVTINYGESRSDAENLFQYGFIDGSTNTTSVILTLEPMMSDPLRLAKVAAFKKTAFIRIQGHEDGQISWESPFLYFSCLTEDDGLAFKTLQEVDGQQNSLRVFWQETDVTGSTDEFERLIAGHKLEDVFKLRVVALVLERIQQQLERLYQNQSTIDGLSADAGIAPEILHQVVKLREIEIAVLEVALGNVHEQQLKLMELEGVSEYLESMQGNNPEMMLDDPETNEEDDPETNEEDVMEIDEEDDPEIDEEDDLETDEDDFS